MERFKEQLPCVTLSRIRRPTYSGYMVEKIHIPKFGSKFIRAKFRPNFGHMCFFNHITTVRGSTNLRSNLPIKGLFGEVLQLNLQKICVSYND